MNIIRIQKYIDISKSYKWENKICKNTFPASLWVSILIDFLYEGMSTSELESKYTSLMIGVNKNSKLMYINSLLRKVQLENKQDTKIIRSHFSKEELENWIVKRINKITKNHYPLSVPKAKKMIKEWDMYYNDVYVHKSNSYDEQIMHQIKAAQMQRAEIKWEKYTPRNNLRKMDLSNNSNIHEDQDATIQKLGKFYFYDELVNKFGSKNVLYNSEIFSNKNSSYDFLVTKNGKKHYYGVRTTKRSTLRFYLSRNEYEFWKQCQKQNNNYSLISIKNLYYRQLSNLPLVEEIENPQLQINNESYGYWEKKILITPTNFISEI